MNAPVPEPIPRKVFLFSGHMIDAPDRKSPRFPASKEPIARQAIEKLLAQLAAGPEDLAICGGACGGDLLFAEASLERSVSLEMYLPFDVSTFLSKSVTFAGGDWLSRFESAKSACKLYIMPMTRPALAQGDDPYEQNNLWMLEAASRFGAEKVRFICLWDGKGGDGPGGTQHLMQEVSRRHGQTHWLDITQLWE
ncbi:MAG: hypothetical protein EOP82_21600 [Variovorax sp.]|nr:MAG: hypothetical protein EOP82_21600 [Variovorax sp.]